MEDFRKFKLSVSVSYGTSNWRYFLAFGLNGRRSRSFLPISVCCRKKRHRKFKFGCL